MYSRLEIIKHVDGPDTSWLRDVLPGRFGAYVGTHGEFRFGWDFSEDRSNPDDPKTFYQLKGTWFLSVIPEEDRSLYFSSVGIRLEEDGHDQRVTIASSTAKEKIYEYLGLFSLIPPEQRTLSLGSVGVEVDKNDHDQRVIIASTTIKENIYDLLGEFEDTELVNLVGIDSRTIWLENYIWDGLLGDEELMAEVEEANRRIIRGLAVAVLDRARGYELIEVTGWLTDLFTFPPAQRSVSLPRSVPHKPPEPPKDSTLDAWFAWRDECQAASIRVTLKYIADKSGFDYGYVRQRHGKYRKLDEALSKGRSKKSTSSY